MERARVPVDEHSTLSWRLSEIAADFRLEDAWALPVHGGHDEFPELVELFRGLDPSTSSGPSRWLFALRERLGRWFAWDEGDPLPIPGCTETSLRDRLPADLAPAPGEPRMFSPVFATPTEWVAELSNATVHAVVQLGWVDEGEGRWRGRLGVYTKPRGWLGRLYMLAIAPFRHLIVYPAMLRQFGRAWQLRRPAGDRCPAG